MTSPVLGAQPVYTPPVEEIVPPQTLPMPQEAATEESSNAEYWDWLKSAGKITLSAVGIAGAVAAFVAAAGIFAGIAMTLSTLPLVAQLSIVAGTLALAIGAFVLRNKYFPAPQPRETPQQQAEERMRERETQLRAVIREELSQAIRNQQSGMPPVDDAAVGS